MNRRREILLASIGSYGDVLPFLSLGRILVRRGYDVTILTSGYFTAMAERAGMKIAPVGTAEQYSQFTSNPDWTRPIRGLRLFQQMLNQVLEPAFDYLRDQWHQPSQLVVANSHCVAARLAQEKFGIQLVSINLSSITLGSLIQPLMVHASFPPEKIPRCLWGVYNRSVHRVTDYFVGKPVNRFRKKLGLPPIRHVMRWWHSTDAVLSLFPDWLTPRLTDWPEKHECLGFPVLDHSDQSIDDEIERILSAPTRPLLFTPGSIASQIDSYVQVCSKVCQQLDRDGILLAPAASVSAARCSDRLMVRSFIPLPSVLPRVAAAVHHGGIGTIAECFRAGVPQLMRPILADQSDNAACVARLGVGQFVSRSQFRTETVSRMLTKLLDDPSVQNRCQDFQQRLRNVDGLEAAADRIEALADAPHLGADAVHA